MRAEIKDIIGAAAPSIAEALGGPLAGMAVRELGREVFGLEDPTHEQVEARVDSLSPDELVKLREADAKFRAELKRAEVDLSRVAAEDRASARDRQIKLGDKAPTWLGLSIVAGFFGILGLLMFFDLPSGTADIFKIMIGALGVMTSQVGNYFFGSSAGSAAKNQMIERLGQRASAPRQTPQSTDELY